MSTSFPENPYQCRLTATRMFGPDDYDILFEEAKIRSITANNKYVEELVFLLNTAWNLGFLSGQLQGRIQEQLEQDQNKPTFTDREQKLVDIAFQLAIVGAQHLNGKSSDEVAKWAATQLEECGFPTVPMGMSWGVLANKPRPEKSGIEIVEPGRPD